MGFFSWKTMDTNKSIPNIYSNRQPFKVVMLDDKGNQWVETEYDGYGVFGGKDYYELLAEMNGVTSTLQGEEYTNEVRSKGIDIAFKDNPNGDGTIGVKYPNLVEKPENWVYDETGGESCEFQGYFYDDNYEDDDDDDNEDDF